MGRKFKSTISELGDGEVFSSLQQKLDELRESPSKTSQTDGIVSLLELTARVQGRLFEALDEHGVPDRKIVPLMASGRLGIPTHKVSDNTELRLIKENLDKTRLLENTKKDAIERQQMLEKDLDEEKDAVRATKLRNDVLKSELTKANDTILNQSKKLDLTTTELKDVRYDNALLKTNPYLRTWPYYSGYYDRFSPYWYRYSSLDYPYYPYYGYADARYWRDKYDDEYIKLKTDLALAKYDTKAILPKSKTLTTLDDITNDSRRRRLIDRYADLFTNDRLSIMKNLRHKCNDEDVIKKIIYTTVVETFRAAQRAFRDFRYRARRVVLSPSNELEINDYILRNLALYDSETTVFEVVRYLNTDVTLPKNVDFRSVLRSFIQELSKTAFEMQTCIPPLDIEVGYQGEVLSENKFRRTFDSEFTAPLIGAHLWPPLVNGTDGSIILKGEAATRHSPFGKSSGRVNLKSSCKCKGDKKYRGRSASPVRGRRTRNLSPKRKVADVV